MSRILLLSLSAALALGCGDDPLGGDPPPEPPPPGAPSSLAVEVVASGLDDPVHLTAPSGDARLFVVERRGRILVIEGGQPRAVPFLDIRSQVSYGGERGLLSIAFHPNYAANGRFYVNYTDVAGDTRVVRYSVSTNPNVADPGSATPLLQIAQPFANHNGGHLLFGPDSMLYIAVGDGGSGGDPRRHGQDRGTLLGALLRIDVDRGDPYVVPPDNPFVGDPAAADEIWAVGLRNPWRLAFDEPAGTLYVADVGQNRWEEISAVAASAAGLNYGWNVMEGEECFNATTCDRTGLTLPVLTYRTGPEGCSVIGGFVYRGSGIPSLSGHYLYSDWCGGWLRSFRLEGGEAVDPREWPVGSLGRIVSFGRDAAGELYLLATQNGTVYRLVPGS